MFLPMYTYRAGLGMKRAEIQTSGKQRRKTPVGIKRGVGS